MPEAVVQRTYGQSDVLNIEKITVNDPADDEILIKQTAIGIHFHDIYVRTGLYKTLNLPGIPGVEASGIIEKLGKSVNNLKVGDMVHLSKQGTHSYRAGKEGCIFEEISTTRFSNDSFYKDKKISKLSRDTRKTYINRWI